jgi:murein DD-endopeptidase MepM/ murein hydrolase activator NlpD
MAAQSGSNKNKKRKPLLPWVSKNHRIVIVNDSTFVEEKAWRLTPFNVGLFSAVVFISISFFTIVLLKFTPLGRLVAAPTRMANQELRKEMEQIYKMLDSLNRDLAGNASYVESIKKLSSEEFEYEKDIKKEKGNVLTETGVGKTFADVPAKSDETKELIETVQTEREMGSLVQSIFLEGTNRIDRQTFVTPVRGVVSDTFAPGRSHYGTDIVAPKGSVIKSARNGTVIMSTWSADTGHMIGIQHDNNLVTWYKHNSSRLKNLGDRVDAGEAIAIIGNSGEMTDGPHLHFELWYNGQPVNPQNYIDF